ncbi:MAG: hypothetical protein ACRCXM_09000 [Beijerinckiaceae bacterium]
MSDEVSTAIPEDAALAQGEGAGIIADDQKPEGEQPKSAREIMEAELTKLEASKEEAPKPKTEPVKAKEEEQAPAEKPEAKLRDGVKPAAAPEEQVAKPSEGKVPEPPARFLPKAREVWANTPNPVKAEIARWEREQAAEAETYKASRQFHEDLREFDDLAKRTGTTVKDALASYVELEQSFAKDPDATLPRLLQKVGMNPMQAVLAVLKSAGATPQQFAEHVRLNPGQYQVHATPQRPPSQPTPDPMARQAMQEVQQLKQQLVRQDVYSTVVAPFAAEHQRYEELQEPIAKILKSGMVPESMGLSERLEVAYDMAERLHPAPYREASEVEPSHATPPVNPVAGKKSIKGAPNGGKAPAMRTPSIRDALASNWPV